ncbi:MAG TPA: molybdopterin-dependent oxidoreductase [Polyangiales bacterium]|nr:molybdopterin-dependent oxidoreductase [Polyangiales bacterium]
MSELVKLTVDGVELQVPKGTLLVEAARTIKQEIPVYCYHTKLGPAGLCRVCLVEIEGMPKLQIACNTQVTDGMVVRTRSDKAEAGRAMVIELLLANHPLDCPICDKGGECDLQDYAMAYGRGMSDVVDPKESKPKAVDLGPTIVLDEERCVVCQRCVRFDDIIVRDAQLVVKDRGHRDIIATATGAPYRHYFTGNVTELCPVGALTSKTYRFKSRPWDLNRTQTSCTQCSVGCRQLVDVRYEKIMRTMTDAEDEAISDGWLCDRGRYNIGFYESPDRLTQPLYKSGGRFIQVSWDDAFDLWASALRKTVARPASIGTIGGGRLTNEEAYLLQHLFRALGAESLDWRAGRQRQATPGARAGKIAEIEQMQAIVIAGEEPAELAPVFDLRVRKAALRQGARILRASDVRTLADLGGVERAALIWDGVDLDLGRALHERLAALPSLRTYIVSEQPNARGAEAMGMLPQAGERDSAQMLADARAEQLDVLSLFGVNPVRNAPAALGAREALERTPFVVVSELFMTETAELATLVLPAKGAFERSGTTTNLAGDVLPLKASLQAPEGPLADLEMLVGLSLALGVELPSLEDVDAAVAQRAARSAEFGFGDARYGKSYLEEEEAPPRHLFSGGGTSAHDERIASLREVPA